MKNEINNEKYFTFNRLNEHDELIHLFTKKPFNFNEYLIEKEKIKDNYNIIFEDFNCNNVKFIKSVQSHTNNVKVFTYDNLEENFIDVDGMITNLPKIALVTYLADCQAILLYDPKKKVIGNIHSGWKGTLNLIIDKAINIMINDFNCNPSDIVACICPSILKCCFEVDYDVMKLFKDKFSDIGNFISLGDVKDGKQKYYIDTVKINVFLMKKLELSDKNIICSNVCTKCNSNFYHSYRKDKDKSGRNIALICLK